MMYNFFFVRKIVGHTCIFLSYCIVLPLTVLIPEVDVPKGGAVFVPCVIAAVNSVFATPRSLHLIFPWILFESAMSFHRTRALFAGLLGTKSANEWVVTEKFGENKAKESRFKVLRERWVCIVIMYICMNELDLWLDINHIVLVILRMVVAELGFAVFVLLSGCYGLVYGKDYYFIYLFLQAITLTIVGFGFIGKNFITSN